MQILHPESEAAWLEMRKRDITSTEIAALYGLSPYGTRFELWHEKRGALESTFVPSERTEWGLALQDAIAAKVASDRGWTIRRMDEYIRHDEYRIGSSFDFEITDAPDHEDIGAILEVKNVDGLIFRQNWQDEDGAMRAPDHIELQVQHQLLCARRKRNYICVLAGGNRAHMLRREIDPDIVASIIQSAIDFWATVENDQPPPPEYPRDASVIARLFGRAEPGKEIEADTETAELMETHFRLGEQERRLSEARDVLKAMILERVTDAETVKARIGERIYTVSAGLIGPTGISYVRAGYRNFRIASAAVKKTKEKA